MAGEAVLAIGGSDSGGGAGIQADLRTFQAFGVHGACAITALTAQSTTEIRGVLAVPAEFVRAQIDTVLDDLPIAVVKTGMLHGAAIVEVVAERIRARSLRAVVDPVLISTTGTRLLDHGALDALRAKLIPAAAVLTPNLPEVEALLGWLPATADAMIAAGRALLALGAGAVVVKGGHLPEAPIDVLVLPDGRALTFASGDRVETRASHGTGCTFASAIAAGLALGATIEDAVARAHGFVHEALVASSRRAPIGRGHGPLGA